MRFLGDIEAKMDAKGRVFLPAAFRKVLQASGEEGLVLRRDAFEPCLTLYPESVWFGMVNALRRRLNRWNAHDQAVLREFLRSASSVALDSNGRLLIPRRELEAVGISQDVRFVGMDDCIELWGSDMQANTAMDAGEFAQALQAAMATARDTVAGTPTTESAASATGTTTAATTPTTEE